MSTNPRKSLDANPCQSIQIHASPLKSMPIHSNWHQSQKWPAPEQQLCFRDLPGYKQYETCMNTQYLKLAWVLWAGVGCIPANEFIAIFIFHCDIRSPAPTGCEFGFHSNRPVPIHANPLKPVPLHANPLNSTPIHQNRCPAMQIYENQFKAMSTNPRKSIDANPCQSIEIDANPCQSI